MLQQERLTASLSAQDLGKQWNLEGIISKLQRARVERRRATELLTRNRSRIKNLALVTLGSSPASGVAVEIKNEISFN